MAFVIQFKTSGTFRGADGTGDVDAGTYLVEERTEDSYPFPDKVYAGPLSDARVFHSIDEVMIPYWDTEGTADWEAVPVQLSVS